MYIKKDAYSSRVRHFTLYRYLSENLLWKGTACMVEGTGSAVL